MSNILNKLNNEQKSAITAVSGPTIILAGAGSGKTRVLVHKVLYLILEKKIDPSHILMLTFSNKAAGEMKERINSLMNSYNTNFSTNPTVSTFHSLCARILRRSGINIGIPHNFLIYDMQDQLDTIKDALKTLGFSKKDIRPKAALETISGAKNQMIDENAYLELARGPFQEKVAKTYVIYQQLLKKSHALDFDDLLNKTLDLFSKFPKVLRLYQDKFHYILIDEYQDTNHSQYLLTKYLGGDRKNICIVGDFSQSIYSFRGADYTNLQKFKKDFPNTKTFKLSQNYRSTQTILDAAHSVISNNSSHPILELWTENQRGEDIEIFEALNEYKEAEFIVNKIIEEKNRNPKFHFSDVAVLYRMNAQSRALEEILIYNTISYKLVGGVRFYARREVKDVLSYLSILSNPEDSVSKKRLLRLGKRRFLIFENYMSQFKNNDYANKKETIDIIDEVLKKSSYLDRYDEKDAEDRSRLENIKELRSVALEFPNLIQFLENVALVEQDSMPDGKKNVQEDDTITLMTIHAAKGLEFKMVFIIGMEEGIFPHSQSLFNSSDLEEERRLCYVGVTRAKEKLHITYARERTIFGNRSTTTASRFIFELPKDTLESNNIDITSLKPEFF